MILGCSLSVSKKQSPPLTLFFHVQVTLKVGDWRILKIVVE